MTEQLTMFLPEAFKGGDPLDWAPATKQPRKPREANFKRLCDACGADMPATGWRPGDLCKACIPPSSLDIPEGSICGRLWRRPRCHCQPDHCEAIPW